MSDEPAPQPESPRDRLRAALLYLVGFAVVLALVYSWVRGPGGVEISYTEFKQRAESGQVVEVVLFEIDVPGARRVFDTRTGFAVLEP